MKKFRTWYDTITEDRGDAPMSLIAAVQDLQAHCAQEPGYFAKLEELLAVLAMFHEEDAETIGLIMQEDVCGCDDPHCQRKTELLARLQAACELMEAKE